MQSEDQIRQRKDSSEEKSGPSKIPKNKLMLGKNYSGLAKQEAENVQHIKHAMGGLIKGEKEDMIEQGLEKPAIKRDLFYFKSSLVSSNENEINY